MELLRGGADPTQPLGEGTQHGLSALGAFQCNMHSSPWLRDEKLGPEFKRIAEQIYKLLAAGDNAMSLKVKGNKAFGEQRFEPALEAWTQARVVLDEEGIAGHHVAVMWSNEAMCCKKMGDLERCRRACEEGLKCICSASVRAKLDCNLAACSKQPPAAPTAAQTEAGTGLGSRSAEARQGTSAKPQVPGHAESEMNPSTSTKASKKRTVMKGGFLNGIGDSKKPMYGPEGSVQGKNHSDLVKVRVNGTMQEVPYGKVCPIEVPNPYLEDNGDDEP